MLDGDMVFEGDLHTCVAVLDQGRLHGKRCTVTVAAGIASAKARQFVRAQYLHGCIGRPKLAAITIRSVHGCPLHAVEHLRMYGACTHLTTFVAVLPSLMIVI
jgi:hypothetical protein